MFILSAQKKEKRVVLFIMLAPNQPGFSLKGHN
jgi:hypothetical protein